MKEGSIELTASIIMEMHHSSMHQKRDSLDFIIRTYKSSKDDKYREHLKSVFWFIVDNYVENVKLTES